MPRSEVDPDSTFVPAFWKKGGRAFADEEQKKELQSMFGPELPGAPKSRWCYDGSRDPNKAKMISQSLTPKK